MGEGVAQISNTRAEPAVQSTNPIKPEPEKKEVPKEFDLTKKRSRLEQIQLNVRQDTTDGLGWAGHYIGMPLAASYLNVFKRFAGCTPVGMLALGCLGMGFDYLAQKREGIDSPLNYGRLFSNFAAGAFSFGASRLLGSCIKSSWRAVQLLKNGVAGALFGASYNGLRTASKSYYEQGQINSKEVENAAIGGSVTGGLSGFFMTIGLFA